MGGKAISYIDIWIDKVIEFLPTLVFGLLIFIIGFWIVNRLDKWLGRYFDRRSYEVSLQGFIRSLVSIGLKIMVIITAAGVLGLPTTSLVAILGAAGLAIGLALQGSLSNFAGGVLILLFKPFKVGDNIKSQGETGVVKEIQIFNTLLVTPDNKVVILPNGAVSNGTIVNISTLGTQRIDLKVNIDFNEDLDRVMGIIMDVLKKDPMILTTPAPSVSVIDIFEGSSMLAIRPWAKNDDYWTVYSNTYLSVRKALLENNIKVHIHKEMQYSA